MATKTSKKAEKSDAAESAPKRVIIRAKTPMAWAALLGTAQEEAWRKLKVTIQLRHWLMAGKPASLDAANAMLAARGLSDQIEAVADITDPELREQAAERIAIDEGLCEFTRRPGKDGIWIPSNNIKAGFKENWSVLGLRMAVRGSRGALAEGIFVCGAGASDMPSEERDWIRVGDAPDGVHTGVSHTVGPKGPVSSINRKEYVERPLISFEIWIASTQSVADKISDDELAKTLVHFGEHGLGANRSQGYGKFDVVEVSEVGSEPAPLEAVG